jgi:hypothetical protein
MRMSGDHDCLSVRVRAEQRLSRDLLPDLLAEPELTGLVDEGGAQEWAPVSSWWFPYVSDWFPVLDFFSFKFNRFSIILR